MSGFILLSGRKREEGEPSRPPDSGTWHTSCSLSKSHRLNLVFGRKTFSRQQLKDRGPLSVTLFSQLWLHLAAWLFLLSFDFCLFDGQELFFELHCSPRRMRMRETFFFALHWGTGFLPGFSIWRVILLSFPYCCRSVTVKTVSCHKPDVHDAALLGIYRLE